MTPRKCVHSLLINILECVYIFWGDHSVLSSVTCVAISHCDINDKIWGENFLKIKCVLIFSTGLSQKYVILIRIRWEITQKYVGQYVQYRSFLAYLMEIEFSRQTVEKYSYIRFHEKKPSSGSQVIHTDARTD